MPESQSGVEDFLWAFFFFSFAVNYFLPSPSILPFLVLLHLANRAAVTVAENLIAASVHLQQWMAMQEVEYVHTVQ